MNMWPLYSATVPILGENFPRGSGGAVNPTHVSGFDYVNYPTSFSSRTWYKIEDFRKPAERLLVSDAYWWKAEAKAIDPTNPVIPGQKAIFDGNDYSSGPAIPGQTTLDFYRHGKYPEVDATGRVFKSSGGKVAYNVLFCDGHAVTMTDRESGYRVIRMKFPG